MEKHFAAKWIIRFFCVVLAILTLLSTIAFIVDPFMQFRVKDNAYMLTGRYVSSGLIKNYDYDTLMIGSSMTQNFDMELFRQQLGAAPLHVNLGGINATEIADLLNLAYDVQKADTYYIGIDILQFREGLTENHFPKHLMKSDFLSMLRYLLSYEVWFGYLPVDIAFILLDKIGWDFPEKFVYQKSIDLLGDWRLDFPVWGEQIVIDHYLNQQYSVSKVDSENLYQKNIAGIDAFFDRCDFTKGEHIFFFPPYSSLFWNELYNRGQLDIYLQTKKYFIEKAMQHGVCIYDFQGADFTMDLDNYKDSTHYMPHINDWMVQCFVTGDYTITADNMIQFQEKLQENTFQFREKYAELFN